MNVVSVNGNCIGASGAMLYHFADSWSAFFDAGGCKLYDMPENFGGDLLGITGGVRYSFRNRTRFTPYVQMRTGVTKLYVEEIRPVNFEILKRIFGDKKKIPNDLRPLWAIDRDATAPSVGVGAGLNFGLTRFLSFRLFSVNYTRAFIDQVSIRSARRTLQFTSGLQLRFGNW